MDALSLFHMVLTKPFHACTVLLLPHTVSPSKSPDQIHKEGKWAVPLDRMNGKAMFQRECYSARNVATVFRNSLPYSTLWPQQLTSFPHAKDTRDAPIPISLTHCRTGTKSRTSSPKSGSNQVRSLGVVHWMQPCRYIFCGTKDLWTTGQVSLLHFPNIMMTQAVDTCIQTGGNG